MPINLPESKKPRVVIIGAGFAGLTLARKLNTRKFQVVLLDKNNYHQFQPLYYQVAMSGLEPSSIAFPLRKIFQKKEVYIRMAEVHSVDLAANKVLTNFGLVNFDYLVFAMGAQTNYYGNENIKRHALPLKSVSEALSLRNTVLADYEAALTERDYNARQKLMDIVIVGGGPTGVELAGALAEMKRYILPKDYGELEASEIDIHLVEGGDRLLAGMSEASSKKAELFLTRMGVKVSKGVFVRDYDGTSVELSDGSTLLAHKLIWAAGIICPRVPGLSSEDYTSGNRIKVNAFLQIDGHPNVFALGDQAYLEEDRFPSGHPQVAQPAIQQARLLARNLNSNGRPKPFKYRDLGSLATIGRNKAVADLPGFKTQGFWAWIIWLVVHLKSILGVKNKIFVLINWIWNYITYDQSLRLIIRPENTAEKRAEAISEIK